MMNLLAFIFFCVFFHSLNEWGCGQCSGAPLSALLRALLRWRWKDLFNGITYRDKCSEPSGSSRQHPAFQRVALICCRLANIHICLVLEKYILDRSVLWILLTDIDIKISYAVSRLKFLQVIVKVVFFTPLVLPEISYKIYFVPL